MNKLRFIPVTLALLVVSCLGQSNGVFWGLNTAFGYLGGGSPIATVSSIVYTVDDNAGTISNVPLSTAKAAFLANLTKDEANQTWNDTGIANPVLTGNQLVVTAQDAVSTQTYTVTVNPTAPVITTVAGNGYINNDEKAAIHIVGTAAANSLVSVTLSDGTPSHNKTGTQQLTGGATAYDITINGTTAPALVDGAIGVAAVATNSLGGTSTSTTTTATKDVVLPTVLVGLGTGAADYTLAATATATITFSEALSTAGKAAVQSALTSGANKTITFGWNGGNTVITITGHATDTTTFANDVMANVTDVAGNSDSLLLIDSAIEATQTTPDNTGAATINSTTPEVVVTDPVLPVTATIASGTSNPEIDVSSFINNGTGTLPAINIVSNNAGNVNVGIPANTTVTSADPAWDGVIAAPTNTTVSIPSTTENLSATAAIQVGFTGAKLSFDKAVRILIPGQAGKRAGYVRTGTTFTEITTACAADTQVAGDALPADGDCVMSVGSDMVIWTKHFTTFASFTAVAGGGGGGGGGGGMAAVSNPFSTANLSVLINNGDAKTLSDKVTLILNGGSNATKMAISNGTTFAGSMQEAYATTKEWTLSTGEGLKTVCVKFYDVNGYYSNTVCDTIAYGSSVVVPTPTNVGISVITSQNIPAIDVLLPYVNYGQTNSIVRQLQNELKKAGFFPQTQVLTNFYGNVTKDAVAKYKASLVKVTPSYSRSELIRRIITLLIQTRLSALSGVR
ncbi:MAG: hypothetical protein PHW52_02590 [Candidatus Pacebacteria bacterium]|nr:hypothetical protein [Candidatus Paceibacterota bacterium]